MTNFTCCLNAHCVAQLRRNLTFIGQTDSVVKNQALWFVLQGAFLVTSIHKRMHPKKTMSSGRLRPVNQQPVLYNQNRFVQWVIQRILNSTLCSLLTEKRHFQRLTTQVFSWLTVWRLFCLYYMQANILGEGQWKSKHELIEQCNQVHQKPLNTIYSFDQKKPVHQMWHIISSKCIIRLSKLNQSRCPSCKC